MVRELAGFHCDVITTHPARKGVFVLWESFSSGKSTCDKLMMIQPNMDRNIMCVVNDYSAKYGSKYIVCVWRKYHQQQQQQQQQQHATLRVLHSINSWLSLSVPFLKVHHTILRRTFVKIAFWCNLYQWSKSRYQTTKLWSVRVQSIWSLWLGCSNQTSKWVVIKTLMTFHYTSLLNADPYDDLYWLQCKPYISLRSISSFHFMAYLIIPYYNWV